MKFGFCAGADREVFSRIAEAGFDYVELALAQLAGMSESELADILSALKEFSLASPACNCFLPGDIKLTGPERDRAKILEYAEKSLEIASRFGVEVVVLGSSGSRNLPSGMPLDRGYDQLAEALAWMAPVAAKRNIAIAIEHLNRMESNIVTTYHSAVWLAALCGQPNVFALADAYHYNVGNESFENLRMAKPRHVHVAQTLGRRAPEDDSDPMLRDFLLALKETGYDGGISVEGSVRDDGGYARAAKYLRA